MDRVGINLFDVGKLVDKPIQLGEYKKCKHVLEKTEKYYKSKDYGAIKYHECKKCGAIFYCKEVE
jgi:hypothetical protein